MTPRKTGRIPRLFVLAALVALTFLVGGAPSSTEAFECGCTYGQWVEIYYYAEPWHATLVGYEDLQLLLGRADAVLRLRERLPELLIAGPAA